METNSKKERFDEAIKYLTKLKMIKAGKVALCLSEKMSKKPETIRGALRGVDRYLNQRFVNTFCAAYDGIISADWIMEGKGGMLTNGNLVPAEDNILSEEKLVSLSRNELIELVRQLMVLHNEQTELYRMFVSQNEQMIRNGQERFNEITYLIKKA